MGSPVLPRFSLCTCRRHYPGGTAGCLSLTFPSNASFPCISARSASTSLVSRPAQRLLALQPAHSRSHLMTLSIEGFRPVVAFPPASIATGWSDPCRKGLAPSQEPCLSTAHAYGGLSSATSFLATVASRALPQNLTPASGCRDHTTSPYATACVRLSQATRPPHPTARFVTIAIRPSFG